MFDPAAFRQLFPIFKEMTGVYLDSAATTQTPQAVLDALLTYYCCQRANVGRGVYRQAAQVTAQVEAVRAALSSHLNLPVGGALVFCGGTTTALNMASLGYPWMPGDNVVASLLEHHSNLLPWMALNSRGVELRLARPAANGELAIEEVARLIDSRTRVVAVTHVSNVLGVSPPVAEICRLAHANGSLAVVDGAQSLGHASVNLSELGCDVYAASAHKAYGPTGVGLMALSPAACDRLAPPLSGGGMIASVTQNGFSARPAPTGWEAGTPPVAEILGWGAALPVLQLATSTAALFYVDALTAELLNGLRKIRRVHLLGPGDPAQRHGVVSFSLTGLSAHRAGAMLDGLYGVMLRSGHHCAIPLHEQVLHLTGGSLRASLAPYNTHEEVHVLLQALERLTETV